MGDFRHGLYLKIYVQLIPEIHPTPQSPNERCTVRYFYVYSVKQPGKSCKWK